MKTRTIGEMLRDERQGRRFRLEDLANRTRIRIEYLEALEANEFEKLPSATFVKGYIKTYAELFGFDHKPLLALLRRDYKESARGTLVPREFITPVLRQRITFNSLTLFVIALVGVFLSLLGYVGVQWHILTRPPELRVSQPAEQDQVASRVVVSGETEPDAVVTVNDQPVALQSDGSFTTEVFISTEGISTISVEATDRRGKTSREDRTVYVRY
ncbi:MAG: helix-turn-helix domain-containing protein [Pseudomonadales bacterium]|nr:helix-turn-helix domain-containing protein [Candidatus Woesebacteria bacterium]MCB9801262.1 helix-turn-helix domain-containing protein [Pseudomonadales bacterium]